MIEFYDVYAACPFYDSVYPQRVRIVCVDEIGGAKISQHFAKYDAMTKHYWAHCCSIKGCEKCAVYKAIASAYAEDAGGESNEKEVRLGADPI